MPNTDEDFFSTQILDDGDLEYIQEVLWRGYTPLKRTRQILESYPTSKSTDNRKKAQLRYREWVENHPPLPEVPQRPQAAEGLVARAELYREIYRNQVKPPRGHAFTCDRCKRRLWARNTEAEAEAEFRKTFGERPPEEPPHYALCEPCYNVMMADAEQG